LGDLEQNALLIMRQLYRDLRNDTGAFILTGLLQRNAWTLGLDGGHSTLKTLTNQTNALFVGHWLFALKAWATRNNEEVIRLSFLSQELAPLGWMVCDIDKTYYFFQLWPAPCIC